MRRSPFTPTLIGASLLVVGVLAWFGYRWISDNQSVAAERATILAAVDVELGRRSIDTGELSQLMARIKRLEDHATASDLLRAQARIEFARDRVDRARDLLLPTASLPGADPADQALAARILLKVQAVGLPDRAAAEAMLEQVISFATSAHDASGDPADLLRAWIAAVRLSDVERSRQFAERIRDGYGGSPEARLVSAGIESSKSELEELKGLLADPPPEVDTLLAMVVLQGGDVVDSLQLVESLLGRGGGIVDVRLAAVAVFQARAMGFVVASSDRERWVARRDAQLAWLLDHAAPDDGRRAAWAALRQKR